jgi:hypothetical protein
MAFRSHPDQHREVKVPNYNGIVCLPRFASALIPTALKTLFIDDYHSAPDGASRTAGENLPHQRTDIQHTGATLRQQFQPEPSAGCQARQTVAACGEIHER